MLGKKRPRQETVFPPGLILGGKSEPELPREPVGFVSAPLAAPPGMETGANRLLTYGGDGHLITFAPTGAGKSAGPVICNALSHPGQLIVVDIKGEVYRATARRRREMGQAVHVLDLRDGMSADSLNPLDLASRTGTDAAAIARTCAAELVARTGAEREQFWNDWAETLLTGGITWLLSDCKPSGRTLGRLYSLFTECDSDRKIARMLDTKEIAARAAVSAFNSFLNLPGLTTRPSVLASALAPLRLFDSDLVRRLTGSTSINLAALAAGVPMTIYIIVPPFRLAAYAPLLRLWIAGLLAVLMRRTAMPRHRTLFLCDEAGNLGRMESFLTASTLLRGWGLTLWSFWQNTAQLDLYGTQARTILDNAGVVQVFGARNRRMAEDFAALVGGIDPDEILDMTNDEQLLLIDGGRPRVARRIRYFDEPMFAGLYDDPHLHL